MNGFFEAKNGEVETNKTLKEEKKDQLNQISV